MDSSENQQPPVDAAEPLQSEDTPTPESVEAEPVSAVEPTAAEPEPDPEPGPEPEAEAESDPDPELSDEPTTVIDADELFGDTSTEQISEAALEQSTLRALVEAVIYVTEEPLTSDQIAAALEQPKERILQVLADLTEDYAREERGITIREVAGGYKMGTKPEHHDAIRLFVRKLKPPLKLSLAALETLAVIAYKQPITSPEIMEVRGVQGASVIKTLLDRKLIVPAGRKQVVGKPILYKTTKDFLLQFGLKDLAELPTLKEFEELRRLAFSDMEEPAGEEAAAAPPTPATEPEEAETPPPNDEPTPAAAPPANES